MELLIVNALLILNSDHVATKVIGDTYRRDIHFALELDLFVRIRLYTHLKNILTCSPWTR